MNYIYILLISIVTLSIKNNSGQVTYKILPPEENELKTTSISKEQLDNAKALMRERCKIEYILTFNENLSSFKTTETLEKNETQIELISRKVFGNLEVFNDSKNKKTYKKVLNENYVESNYNIKWKTLKNSKKIDQYLCYKSIATIKYISRGKEKEKTIEAWYAPEIPFSFGPSGYYGLPGLILELKDGKLTYVAQNIKLNNENITIKLPSKNIISEDEYNKKLKEIFTF